MDNSHIFRISQQCQPLLLPRMLRLPLPRSSHTKKGIRHGPAGKHVQTGTCAHSLHPCLCSQEMAGNTEKRIGGSEHWRKGPSFIAGSLQKSPGDHLQHSCNRPTDPAPFHFLVTQIAFGMAWYEGIPGLVWHTATCREGAANENKALPWWCLPNQPFWSLLVPGVGSAFPKPLGHSHL